MVLTVSEQFVEIISAAQYLKVLQGVSTCFKLSPSIGCASLLHSVSDHFCDDIGNRIL